MTQILEELSCPRGKSFVFANTIVTHPWDTPLLLIGVGEVERAFKTLDRNIERMIAARTEAALDRHHERVVAAQIRQEARPSTLTELQYRELMALVEKMLGRQAYSTYDEQKRLRDQWDARHHVANPHANSEHHRMTGGAIDLQQRPYEMIQRFREAWHYPYPKRKRSLWKRFTDFFRSVA